jgi:hypothetical protein
MTSMKRGMSNESQINLSEQYCLHIDTNTKPSAKKIKKKQPNLPLLSFPIYSLIIRLQIKG